MSALAEWLELRETADSLVCWHPSVFRILGRLEGRPVEGLVLRSIWTNWTREKPGALADLIEARSLTLEDNAVEARAGCRLASALAIARLMLGQTGE